MAVKKHKTNFAEELNYCDNRETLSEFFNWCVENLLYDCFKNQEDIVYMHGELGKKRKPMIKEDAIEKMENLLMKGSLGLFIDEAIVATIKHLHEDGDIDVSVEVAREYNEYFSYKEGDKGYITPTEK